MGDIPLIHADWPAPANVQAVVSTRIGGVSIAPWDSLNLGTHVADDPADVADNREQLLCALQKISACAAPQWLNQVHGTVVIEADRDVQQRLHHAPDADAVTTTERGLPCVVMTADCLPVFFCDQAGTRVAVAHAGWRGLCDGVLEATLATFSDASTVLAWMGPAIGPEKFEVGEEVRRAFVEKPAEKQADRQAAVLACFQPSHNAGRWMADIYALARLRLQAAGVKSVHGGGLCTVTDSKRFFSYRRDGRTGRMASVIWLG